MSMGSAPKPYFNKRASGALYEKAASDYLEDMGYTVVARNFRSRNGEIDIVATDGDCVCFVEVKHRNSASHGRPAAAVTLKKQRNMISASEYFLYSRKMTGCKRRYDVIEITGDSLNHIKNAFMG